MKITLKPTLKQHLSYEALKDDSIKYVLLGGGAGGGKDVCTDTAVLTDKGWIKAGEVTSKNKLVSVDGTYTNITGIYPQGLKQTYEIIFDDGTKAIAGAGHLWLTWNSDHGKRDGWKVRDTETLFNSKGRHSIPLMDNPAPGNYVSGYDAYILGYIIGNGTLTGASPTIYTTDTEITDYLKDNKWNIYQYKENVYQCHLTTNGEASKIYKELPKVSGQKKHIPKDLLNGTPETRIALLQGLMDSDGTVDKDGSCSYSTMSQSLAEDVVYLVRSLGGKSSIEKKKRIGGGSGNKFGSKYHELDVRVSHCNRFMPFRLTRKKDRVRTAVYDKRYIKSIKKLDVRETICFSVDHPTHLFIIEGFVVTHNSWFGCEWLLQMCLLYPGTKWFIGRQELTRLMASSYVTFMKVCSWHKIPEGTWKLNGKYNYIDFANGSRIDLLDVQMKPSDPMYERFGSLEYTGGWLEEAGEIHADAYDVLKSRIGRHMNKDFDIKSKLLLTCNPKKNFLYTQFYKPWKEKTLPKNCAFIQSLYMDNPFTADEYGENLAEMKSQSKKERLMKGNWEYDDDPNKIMEYDAIIDMWTNNIEKGKDKYIVVDAAGEGKDKATLYLWEGWVVTKTKQIDQCNSNELEEAMKDFCNDNQVPRSHMIVDKTGLGWAIPGHLACKGFISQNSAIQPKEYIMDPKRNADKKANYANLRSQCSFLFAEKVNNHEVSILPTDHKETIIEECEVIKEINDDSEKPLRVIGKDEIKEAIGRSPDHFDNLMMRMWFELNKKPEKKQTSTKAAANFYGF